MKKRGSKNKVLKYAIIGVIIIFATYLTYSTLTYYKSGIKETGLVFCEKEECFLAPGDVHAQVDIYLCGEYFNLPLDKGSTEGPHTHKERNLAHFEGKLPYHNYKKMVSDNTYIKLGSFMDTMEVKFTNQCISDKCNADMCENTGKSGKLTIKVNGKENNEFREYVWNDKDKIIIKFE